MAHVNKRAETVAAQQGFGADYANVRLHKSNGTLSDLRWTIWARMEEMDAGDAALAGGQYLFDVLGSLEQQADVWIEAVGEPCMIRDDSNWEEDDV